MIFSLPSVTRNTVLFCAVFLLLGNSLWAQNNIDSSQVEIFNKDSLTVSADLTEFNKLKKESIILTPKRIGLYSAILPGLGQIINKDYWKLPIIYGGLAAVGYYIYDNNNQYNDFRKVLIGREANDPEAFKKHPELESISQLQDAMNYHKYYLDLSVLISLGVYGVQILDALVFSNLKGFDISEDISLKVEPVIYPTGGAGIGLVMKF